MNPVLGTKWTRRPTRRPKHRRIHQRFCQRLFQAILIALLTLSFVVLTPSQTLAEPPGLGQKITRVLLHMGRPCARFLARATMGVAMGTSILIYSVHGFDGGLSASVGYSRRWQIPALFARLKGRTLLDDIEDGLAQGDGEILGQEAIQALRGALPDRETLVPGTRFFVNLDEDGTANIYADQ